MHLKEKYQAASEVFDQLDKEVQGYASRSKLNCFPWRSQCYSRSDVAATVLKFLPLAFLAFPAALNKKNLAQLTSTDPGDFCVFLKKIKP